MAAQGRRKLRAKGAVLSPGKRDFTIYFAMLEILMFFEKSPTFYLKQLQKNVSLSSPVRLAGTTPGGVLPYITYTGMCRPKGS